MAPTSYVPWEGAPACAMGSLPLAVSGASPACCATPIASLIYTLKRHKTFSLDRGYANKVVAPLVFQLDAADKELQKLLTKFGWCSAEGFSRAVDVKGLQAALQKYQYVKIAVIGTGAYGAVHKVVNRETREMLAIKQVPLTERGLCEATLREISTLRELHHPNVVKLRDVISSAPPTGGRYAYLVLELLEGDLYGFMAAHGAAHGGLDLRTIKSIMFQVLTGLHHAHSHGIMHRDLKPQNILLGPAAPPAAPATTPSYPAAAAAFSGGAATATAVGAAAPQSPLPPHQLPQSQPQLPRLRVKIADFGLARAYLPLAPGAGVGGGAEGSAAAYTEWVVTLYYRAPELLLGCRHYGPAVDLWSAGCVLAELLRAGGPQAGPLFVADCEIGMLRDVFSKMGTPMSRGTSNRATATAGVTHGSEATRGSEAGSASLFSGSSSSGLSPASSTAWAAFGSVTSSVSLEAASLLCQEETDGGVGAGGWSSGSVGRSEQQQQLQCSGGGSWCPEEVGLPGLEALCGQQMPTWQPVPLEKLVPRLASDPLGADLLRALLSYDPRTRPTASQALSHPWFDDVR